MLKPITESLFFLSLFYLTFNAFRNWNHFSSCFAPSHIFLILAYGLMFSYRVIHILRSRFFLPYRYRSLLDSILHWIIYPVFIATTFSGMHCHHLNHINSPACWTNHAMPWTVWLSSVVVATINTWSFLSEMGNIFLSALYKLFDRRFEALLREYQVMGGHITNFPEQEGYIYYELQDKYIRLNNDEIESIPRVAYSQLLERQGDVMQEACPVCFDDYKPEDSVYILPKCNHIFHIHCVEKWLKRSVLCPMCRANIKTNLQNEKEHVIIKALLTAAHSESQECA